MSSELREARQHGRGRSEDAMVLDGVRRESRCNDSSNSSSWSEVDSGSPNSKRSATDMLVLVAEHCDFVNNS